jgi:hypothetical protein
MRKTFLVTIVVVNLLLWVSYVYFLKGETNMIDSKLWNNIQQNERYGLLLMAGIAYILNLVLAVFLAYSKHLKKDQLRIILYAYIGYYVLQLLFVPLLILYTNTTLVKKQNNIYKILIQLLLMIVVVPMFIIMIYGLKETFFTYTNKKTYTALILGLSSMLPFLHVLINDAYKFGFYF